jgi:glycosyltransferase involved in cell wall biosynthesis
VATFPAPRPGRSADASVSSVSIVLPTRNRPQELIQALERVAAQIHPELELVLVRDGGSPFDASVTSLLESLEFPARVLEHEDPPHGLATSRNRGIDAARGDAVAFLDDDDLWESDHVARLARALDLDPVRDVVYADAWIQDEVSGERRALARDFDLNVFGRDSFIAPSAMAVRTSAFDRFGLFDTEIPYSEDWDWLMRVAVGGGRIARVPGASVTIRIHPGGMSALRGDPERLAARQQSLDTIASRYGLAPMKLKTFWEVAGTLCPPNASTR